MVSAIDLKALDVFISSPVSQDMIHKLVVATLQVLPCQDSKNKTYAASSTETKPLPSLMTFLTKLVRYTNVYTGTLMATLVYLNKLKSKLPKNAQGLPCTRHRIVMSCLILSSKFHNDSSPKNVHWAKYTDGLFSTKDINLMERQLLYLLNWDLKVTNEEMVDAIDSFLEPIRYDIIKSAKMRKFMSQKKREQKARQEQNSYLDLPTRSSSVSSISSSSSLLSAGPTTPHSQHYRQNSSSSISSVGSSSSLMDNSSYTYTPSPTRDTNGVDPIIELTALKEEIELNKLLRKLNNNNTLSQTTAYAYKQ